MAYSKIYMTHILPISVCMIVRDEEKNLSEAIESVRAFVDEIIVVDTGSQDCTVEIARSLGANVLLFSWKDDFSLARNVSLQAARNDWILTLDADQRFDPSSLPALVSALNQPCMAQIVTINLMTDDSGIEILSSYKALRLFRRDERIRYRGRVHECVGESLLEIDSTDWPDSCVNLNDIGYVSASERQKKRERNITLLKRSLTERPDNLFIAYKLAISLPNSQFNERCEILFDAINQARVLPLEHILGLTFMPRLLAEAVKGCVEQGYLCKAAEMAQSMMPALGFSGYFTAGRAIARTGQVALASEFLINFLEIFPKNVNLLVPPDLDATVAEACRWLAWLARLTGNFPQARIWLQIALENATMEQRMAIECESIRVNIDEGKLTDVNDQINRLYPMAESSTNSYAELMLVSAEVSNAVGDRAGAIELAQAAVTASDDRAAALLATLELRNGHISKDRLQQLLINLPGRRFDTLAVRLILERLSGLELKFEAPISTKELMLNSGL